MRRTIKKIFSKDDWVMSFTLLMGGFKVSRNYAVDYAFIHFVRSYHDGIVFFELNFNIDYYKADHNPQTVISLTVLNFTIFEITVYNVNHVEHDEDEKIGPV